MINRYADPIEYVLNRLKYGIEVDKFDIFNALAELEKIKNKKPVGYYSNHMKTVLWDIDISQDDSNALNSNYLIPLYMGYK